VSVLVTGGTGSFGQAYVQHALDLGVERVVVYSRDEHKQWEMQRRFDDSRLRFFIGDVRDADRLRRAMEGITHVIHAAALKHVPVCEYNPFEAVKTNIIGSQNVADAAIDAGVLRVVALSSDKAAAPANLYGATKLASERLICAANNYVGTHKTRLCAVRYGNVLGSRGSVVPLFREQAVTGRITITDERMTRFSMTMPEAISLVDYAVHHMDGGEVFVSKCPSYHIADVAEAVAPEAIRISVGMRPGEHLHEVMVTEDEQAVDVATCYVLPPGDAQTYADVHHGIVCDEGWRYASDTNWDWLTAEEIRHALEPTHAGIRHSTQAEDTHSTR
jgi:UDP-N-acetylglucosamine 4,6-dehydratase